MSYKVSYYKLLSPYAEDETKNCKLTITDIDSNFLAFKDNDISGATFDEYTKSLNILRNNGETISIDLSSLQSATPHEESGIHASVSEKCLTGNTDCFMYEPDDTETSPYSTYEYPAHKCKYYEGNEVSGKCNCIYCLIKEATNKELPIVTSATTVNNGIKIDGSLSDDGVLTITWEYENEENSGGSFSISGVVSTSSGVTSVAHDSTLFGNGTVHSPLRISNNEKTSSYKPALGIVTELPDTTNLKNGVRYITKEYVNDYGYLYKAKAIAVLKNLLEDEESIWRVPTKEDWDKMLNFVEICDEDRNHSDEGDNVMLGKYAGLVLKSKEGWSDEDIEDNYGFNCYPVKPIRTSDYDIENVVESAMTSFWTSTSGYAKTFIDSTHEVYQDMPREDDYCSIRLVADYDSNRTGFNAEILGNTYEIVHFQNTKQIWTKTNLYYMLSDRFCFEPTEENAPIHEYYYINHWNGNNWEKKKLEVGDKISVIENDVITDYYVTLTNDNKYVLVKTLTVQASSSGNTIVNLDCGWY